MTRTPRAMLLSGASSRFHSVVAVIAFLALALTAEKAHAQTDYFWNAGTGGVGNWDITTQFWSTLATGPNDYTWINSGLEIANFGDTAGTVTLTVPITAHSLKFTTSGYIITGSTLTLSNGGVDSGAGVVTINSIIAGTNGLNKTGAGTLTLGGANTYTGVTNISAGILVATTLANGGTASSIGASTSAAANLVINATTLRYTGAATSTDRLFTLAGLGGTIDANGTGALAFSNAGSIAFADAGAKTLTLSGTSAAAAINVLTPIIGDNGVDVVSVTKSGANTWQLGGLNTYTGITRINGGVLVATVLANGGVASNIGQSSSAAGNLILDTGTLRYAGAAGASDRLFTVGAGGGTIDSSGTGALQLNGPGSVAFAGSGNRTITLAGTNTNVNQFGLVIADVSGTDLTSVAKSGAGTWSLGAANTYTGTTTLSGGILAVSSLDNGGVVSNIGASSNAAANIVFSGGTLQYTGAAVGTDRLFTLNTTGGTIDSSGSGALTLSNTGAIAYTGSGARTLILSGTATGNVFAPTLADSGGATALTKNGAGSWILSNANTHTGATTITAGTLTITNNLALQNSTATINVANGLLFATGITTPTLGGLAGTGSLALTDGASAAVALTVGNNGFAASNTGIISGTGSITKIGAGVQTLGGANTYTGITTINAGVLAATVLANGGVASGIGQTTNAAANLVLNGGTLRWTGTPAASTDRLFTVTLNGGGIDGSGAANVAITFANTGAVVFSGSGARTLTFGGSSTGANTFASLIGNGGGATSVTKIGAGVWNLSAANTYTGVTTVTQGILSTATFPNGGVASGIGQATNVPANIVLDGGTLRYNGAAVATSDRQFSITINGGAIDSSNATAANLLTLNSTAAITFIGSGARTLTLAGSNTGVNVLAALVIDEGANPTSLTKAGAGTWSLSNVTNSYTGVTTLTAGILVAPTITNGGIASSIGAASSAPANIVFNGGTLSYRGAVAINWDRDFTVNTTGGTLDASGTVATATLTTLSGAMTFGTANAAATFNVGGTNTGNNTFNYTIANNGTGVVGFGKSGAGVWFLTATNSYTGVTTVGGGTLVVPLLANGGVNSSIGASSNAAANLVFNGAGLLRYTGPVVSIDRGFTLNTGGGGFENNGTGALTLASTAAIALLGTNPSPALLLAGNNTDPNIFNPTLGNSGTGASALTKSGTNTWVINSINTFTGITTINGGTLIITNNLSLQNSPVAVNTANGLIFATGVTTPSLGGFSGGTGSITLQDASGTPVVLTIGGSNLSPAAAAVNISGPGSIIKVGTGAQILSGVNTFNTPIVVNGGVFGTANFSAGLTPGGFGASSNAASNILLNNGAILRYTGAAGQTDRQFTINTAGAGLDANNTAVASWANLNPLTFAGTGSRTLTLGGTGTAAMNLWQKIVDPSGGVLTVTKTGTSIWALHNYNTFTGQLSIAGGVLTTGLYNQGGAPGPLTTMSNAASSILISGGGLLGYSGSVAVNADRDFTIDVTGGGLDSSGTGAITYTSFAPLTFSGAGARTFTLGGSGTAANTLNRQIIDAGGATAVSKTGAGLWILNNANTYTGTTTLAATANNALRLSDNLALGSTTGGTVVGSTARLELTNGLVIVGEPLTITGTGGNNLGAIQLVSGQGRAEWTGPITLSSAGATDRVGVAGTQGTVILSGVISSLAVGNGLLVRSNASNGLVILGSANTFNGPINILGRAQISTIGNVGGGTSSLGAPTTAANGTITGGSDTVGSDGWLVYTGAGNSSDRVLTIGGTTTANGGSLVLDASGTGAITYTSNLSYPAAVTVTKPIMFSGTSTAANTFAGIMANGLAATPPALSLVKFGPGQWLLNNANTYTGSTTVSGGTLTLDFSGAAAPASVISASSALILGGGTLQVTGRPAAIASQVVASTAVNNGSNNIVLNLNGGTAVQLTMGAITRALGGTINFSTPASTAATTTTANTNSILGGYATFNQNTWAVGGGTITGLATYTANTWAAIANNTDATASFTATAAASTNSVRFNTAAAVTITLNGANILGSGTLGSGILVTAAVGNNASIITGGTSLTSSASSDIVVHQYNTANTLAINSVIVNTTLTGITKTGPGVLILGATNTFTGVLRLNEGVLQVAAVTNGGTSGNLGAGTNAVGNIIFNGGTLRVSGAAGTTDRLFTLLSKGGTIENNGTALLNFSNGGAITITGVGDRTLTLGGSSAAGILNVFSLDLADATSGITSFTKTGVSTWQITGDFTYSGPTTVSGGILQIGNGTNIGTIGAASTISLATGTTFATSRNDGIVLQNYMSGLGGYTNSGTGTVTLTGINTYTGPTSIDAGTVIFARSSALPSTTAISLKGTIGLNYAFGQAVLNQLATSASGTLALGFDNANALNLSAPTNYPTLSLGAVGGTFTYSGTLTPASTGYRLGGGGGTLIVTSTLDTAASLTIGGSGTGGTVILNPSAPNAFTSLVLTSGTVVFANPNAAPALGGTFTVPAGSAVATNPAIDQTFINRLLAASAGTVGLAADSGNPLDFTAIPSVSLGASNGTFTYSGALTQAGTTYRLGGGAGTLIVTQALTGAGNSLVVGGSGTAGTVILPTANTYGGGTTISAGSTLQLGAGGTVGSVLGNIVTNGTLEINRSDNFTVNQFITGTGGFTQEGSNVITVIPQFYTGPTSINAGVISTNSIMNGNESSGLGASTNAAANLVINGGILRYTGPAAFTDRLLTIGNQQGSGIEANGPNALQFTNVGAAVFAGSGGRTFTLGGTTQGNVFGPVLADSGGPTVLIKEGTGSWILTGASTYTGATFINAGTLQIGNNGTAGSLTGTTVINNGTLILARSDTQTITTILGGSGAVIKQFGAGNTTLNATNVFNGPVTIHAGTLTFQTAASRPVNDGGVLVNSGTTAAYTVAIDQTFLNKINPASTGVVALNLASANALNLNGYNNLSVGAIGAFTYSGTLTPAGTTYRLGGGGGALTVSSILAGATNTLVIARNGTAPNNVILSGANGFTGVTIDPLMTLTIGAGAAAGTLGVSTGAVINNGNLVFNRNDPLGFQVSNNISGSGSVSMINAAGVLILAGANTYTGGTIVSAGNAIILSSAALPTGGDVYLPSGVGIATAGYALDQLGVDALSPLSRGVIAIGFNSAENLSFANLPFVSLGASLASPASFTYNGVLTPFGTTYRLGGGGQLVLDNAITLDPTKNLRVVGGGGTSGSLTGAVNLMDAFTQASVQVDDGLLAVTGPLGTLTSAGGITVNGSGFVKANIPFSGAANTRSSTLVLGGDTVLTDRLGTTLVRLNNGELMFAQQLAGNLANMTVQNVTAIGGMSTISVAGATATTSATFTVSNLIRNAGAAIDFRSYSGTLGGGTAADGAIFITNLNGAAPPAGFLGGWATTNNNFAAYSATNGVVVNAPNLTTSTTSITTGTSASNVLANNATISPNQTLIASLTINSLINETNTQINAGFTLILNSGGLIFRTAASTINPTVTTGIITSGFVDGAAVSLFSNSATGITGTISAVIANNGVLPLRLVKTGDGVLQLGNSTTAVVNTFTGGTLINSGTLVPLNLASIGTAGVNATTITTAVTVAPGATLQVGTGTSIAANAALQWVATIQGTGFNNAGAITNITGANSQTSALRSLTLTGDAAINPVVRFDVRPSIFGPNPFLSLNGFTLTKNGAGQFSAVGVGQVGAGNIVINNNIFGMESNTVIPASAGNSITVNSSASRLGVFETVIGQIVLGRDINLVNGGVLGQFSAGGLSFRPITSNISIVGPADATIDPQQGPMILTGLISGTTPQVGLVKTGASDLILLGNNTYTGATTISAGTLTVLALSNGGVASPIGASTSAASNLFINGGTFEYEGTGAAATDRLFMLGTTGGTIDASGGGTLTFGNSGPIEFFLTGSRTLTLDGTNTGLNTFNPAIVDQAANPTSLVKNGVGTWLLNGNNTFTGPTTINAGNLILNYTAANNSKIAAGNTLTMNGGTLTISGNTSAPTTQSIGGLIVGSAFNRIIVNDGGASAPATLNLGAIANLPGGVIDFKLPTNGAITTTTANNWNTILGGFAIVGGNTWAVSGVGAGPFNISGLAAGSYSGSFAAGNDVDMVANATVSTTSINSLRVSTAIPFVGQNLTSTGVLTVASGGVLVTSAAGANELNIRGGNIVPQPGSDLNFILNNTGTTVVASTIGDATNNGFFMTVSGTGKLFLQRTAANTFLGGVTVNGATLQIIGTGNADLPVLGGGIAKNITMNNGGFFQVSGATYDPNATNKNYLIGASGGGYNVDRGLDLLMNDAGQFGGTGPMTKIGDGQLRIEGQANVFTGSTTILAGTLIVTNAGSLGAIITAEQNVFINGGTLNVGVASFPKYITVQGKGFNNAGALISSGGAGTITGPVDFAGTTAPFVGGSGNLTITGPITSTIGFAKFGTATLTVNGVTLVTGPSTVYGGNLTLDFQTANFGNFDTNANAYQNSKLDPTQALILNGGGVTVRGNQSASTTQVFNGITLDRGANSLIASSSTLASAAANTTIDTRGASGTALIADAIGTTLTFTLTTGVAGNNPIIQIANANASGILGGWAYFGAADFATNNAGVVAAFTGYSTNTFGAALNTDVTSNQSPAAFTTNSIRFSTAASTLTLSGLNTVTSGGILSTATFAYTVSGGSLTSTAGEMVFMQNSTGVTTVNSQLTGNMALTKSGANNLTLTNASNNFVGPITIAQGTLQSNAVGALGSAANTITLVGNASVLALRSDATSSIYGNDVVVLSTNPAATINADRVTTAGGVGIIYLGGLSVGYSTLTVTGTNNLGIQFNGPITLTGNATLNTTTGNAANATSPNNTNDLLLRGVVSDGAETFNLTLANPAVNTGTATVFMNQNTYKGGTFVLGIAQAATSSTVSGGNLVSGPFGTGPIIMNTGVGQIRTDGRDQTIANNLVLSGSGGTYTFASPSNNFPGTGLPAGVVSIGSLTFSNAGLTNPTSITLIDPNPIVSVSNTIVTFASPISGFNLTKAGNGKLILSGDNSGINGSIIVNGGILQFNNSAAIGGFGRNVTVNSGGILTFPTAFGTIQGTLTGRVLNTSAGVIGLSADSSESLDFSAAGANLTAASLGAIGAVTYTGALTPNGTTFRLGGGAGTLTFAPIISGANNLVTGGNGSAGIVIPNSANTYTGTTTLNASVMLSTDNLQNGGVASGIGQSTNAAANLVVNGGILQYTGPAVSIDRLFTLGTTAGSTIDASGTGALNLAGPGAIVLSGTNTARTVIVSGSNTGLNTLALTLGNNGTGLTSVTKTGGGTWVFSGANAYTGVTTLNQGTLQISSLANGGVAGNIGQATNAAANIVFNGGTLLYTGATTSTDRLFTLNAGGATIDSSGTGVMNFTNTGAIAIAATTGNRTLTLTGNTGTLATPNTFSTSLADSVAVTSLTSLVKNGTGVWQLNTPAAASTFTGTTTINGGSLVLNSTTAIQSSTVVLNIANGLQFGSAITAATVGGLTGASNLTLDNTAAAGVVLSIGNGNFNSQYNGILSGQGGVAKLGTGLFTPTGNNTYAGVTSVNAGLLIASTLANGGVASSIGASTNAATNLVLGGGSLIYTGTSPASTDRLFTISVSSFVDAGVGINFTNTGVNVGPAAAATLALRGSGTSVINSILADGVGQLTLTTSGSGTWAFTNASTFTGPLNVNSGTVLLDFSATGAPTSNIFAAAVAYQTNGGNLRLRGATGATNSQTLNGALIPNNGPAIVALELNGATSLTLNFGVINRLLAGSSVNFIAPVGTTITTTQPNNAAGILGSYALFNTNDFAANGASIGAATYVVDDYSSPTNNVNATVNNTFAASASVNTIRFDAASPVQLNSSGVAALATSGLLVTSNVGANAITIAPGAGGMTLQGLNLNGGDLVVHQNNTAGTLTISAVIENAPAQVQPANLDGTVNVTGLTDTSTLYPGMPVSGTNITAGTTISAVVNLTSITLSTAPAAGTLTTPLTFTSRNSLTKAGPGTLLLSGLSTYTGPTFILGGVLSINQIANGGVASTLGQSTNAAGNLFINGGTLRYTGPTASTDRLVTFSANGGVIDGSGAGPITFTNAGSIAGGNTGPRTITLTGSTSGNVFTPNINDQTALTSRTAVVISGTGSWTLVGATSNFSGGLTVNAGATVAVTSNASMGNAINQVTINGGTLNHAGSFISPRTLNVSGVTTIGTGAFNVSYAGLNGSGTITKSGVGMLNLTGGTYSGGYSIDQGLLALTSTTVTGPVVVNAGTLALNQTNVSSTLNLATSGGVLRLNTGLFGDYYSIVPNSATFGGGAGTFNPDLTSVAAFNAAVAGRTPLVSTTSGQSPDFNFGNTGASFPVPFNAGGLNFMAKFTGNFVAPTAGTYTFSTAADDGSVLLIDGQIVVNSNTGQAVVERSTTIDLTAGSHSMVILYYQATGGYGLQATITAPSGVKTFLSNSLLNNAGAITVNSLSGIAGTTVDLGSSALTVGDSTPTTTYAGTIIGTGSINKTGSGTLELTGASTYSGGTTVNNGILAVNNTSGSGTGTGLVIVSNGARLRGIGTISGPVRVDGGGTVRGGNSIGTLKINNNVVINSTATLNGTIETEAIRSGVGTTSSSLIDLSGSPTSTFNLNPGAGNKFTINVLSDNSLLLSENYLIDVAKVGTPGNIQLNGVSLPAGTVIDPSNYVLNLSNVPSYSITGVLIDSTGTILQVSLATPEPHHVLLIAVGVLLVGWTIRRRLTRTATV